MSSALRTIQRPYDTSTKVMPVHSVCYSDTSTSQDLLFPFIVNANGVLDIAYTNSFESDMVDTTGQPPDDGGDDPTFDIVLLGNERLVKSLGDNFKAYIRAWRTATIDSGSDINLVPTGCIMMNARSTRVRHSNAFEVVTIRPTINYFNTNATTENNFITSWIFKRPLTIEITESGIKKYITFATTFEDD